MLKQLKECKLSIIASCFLAGYIFACSSIQYSVDARSQAVRSEALPGVPDLATVESSISVGERFTTSADKCEIIDSQTGLVWLRTPPSTTQSFTHAVSTAITSTWCGHAAGTWRVPTIKELTTLINTHVLDPEEWLNKPATAGGPGFNLRNNNYSLYWSSTSSKDKHPDIWYLDIRIGAINTVSAGNSSTIRLWPVRDIEKYSSHQTGHPLQRGK